MDRESTFTKQTPYHAVSLPWPMCFVEGYNVASNFAGRSTASKYTRNPTALL